MITERARAEADRFLRFYRGDRDEVTEEHYEEWFLWDSRGQLCSRENPIVVAKKQYEEEIWQLRDGRGDDIGWPGGLYMLDLPIRFLIEAFGRSSVTMWALAFFEKWPGNQSLFRPELIYEAMREKKSLYARRRPLDRDIGLRHKA